MRPMELGELGKNSDSREISKAEVLPPCHVDKIIKSNKLILLVDLDKTLIDTVSGDLPAIEGIHQFMLDENNYRHYHTRVRPGTREFLLEISKFFEMHICTHGSRRYAKEIAKFIDPKSDFFCDRIIAREDSTAFSKTQILKSRFLHGDSIVCIIDDREDMWESSSSLVQVKPYKFFENNMDDFGSIMSIDLKYCDIKRRITDDNDDYLLYLEDILKMIHKAYFNMIKLSNIQESIHLGHVIPYVQKKVLKGIVLVFSGVFPINVPIESNRIWRLANKLGARVETQVTKETTHLVAANVGTDKVVQAQAIGSVFIVTLDWFYCCEERWERVDERLFNFSELCL